MFGGSRSADGRRSTDSTRPVSAGPRGSVPATSTVPAPLLLLPSTQSLTFGADDVQPGLFMPVPLQPPQAPIAEQLLGNDEAYEGEMDSFVGEGEVSSGTSQQAAGVPTFSPGEVSAQALPTMSSSSSVPGNMFRMSGRPRYAAPSQIHPATQPAGPPNFAPHGVSSTMGPSGISNIMTPLTGHSVPPAMDYSRAGDINAPTSQTSPPTFTPGSESAIATSAAVQYIALTYHWFYCKNVGLRQIWHPMSFIDSARLEEAYRQATATGTINHQPVIVRTDGDRFDVDVASRCRRSVYWEEPETRVRRCSWFYRSETDGHLTPYEEDFCELLEENYRSVLSSGQYHMRRLVGQAGDAVIIHSTFNMLHFLPISASASSSSKSWMNASTTQMGEQVPRVIKRGVDEMNIFQGESEQADHVVFVVHGIGPTCDLRFRNIVDCINDMRNVAQQMQSEHFTNDGTNPVTSPSADTAQTPETGVQGSPHGSRKVGRIELLPVSWHAALHGDATGIDRKLKAITLNSIGKLRQYTNDTLLDVLFYGSPAYAQKIADTVGGEINRLYQLFCSRNPQFSGGVSLAGHSLGSLILFDLLSHQKTSMPDHTNNIPAPNLITNSSSASLHSTSRSSSAHELAALNSQSASPVPVLEGCSGDDVSPTIEQILTRLGLTEYIPTFESERIDSESLLMVEESDLKEMGLPLGPKKKLSGFIKEQKEKHQRKVYEAEVCKQNSAAIATPHEFTINSSNGNPVLGSFSSTSVDFEVASSAGTGIPFVKYPQLDFYPTSFFALGSPVAMFLTVRGVDCLGPEFCLPTCPGFYNIFHPFDPVAYRMEPMVIPGFPLKPVLMPHHKGRKRMHLELKESLTRVGYDIKQRVVETVKSTWRTINDFALAHRANQALTEGSDPDRDGLSEGDGVGQYSEGFTVVDDDREVKDPLSSSSANEEVDYPIGSLNNGRRIDYVLQEKPIESFNDYLFALSSHACYWDSEDTVLMILKEIYATMGITPIKQQALGGDSCPPPPPTSFPRHPLVSRYGGRPVSAHTTPLSIYRQGGPRPPLNSVGGPNRPNPPMGDLNNSAISGIDGQNGSQQQQPQQWQQQLQGQQPVQQQQQWDLQQQQQQQSQRWADQQQQHQLGQQKLQESYMLEQSYGEADSGSNIAGSRSSSQATFDSANATDLGPENFHSNTQLESFAGSEFLQNQSSFAGLESSQGQGLFSGPQTFKDHGSFTGLQFSQDQESLADLQFSQDLGSFAGHLTSQNQGQFTDPESHQGSLAGPKPSESCGPLSGLPVSSYPPQALPSIAGPRASMGPPLAAQGRGRGMGPPISSRMGPPPGASSGARPPIMGFVRK